MLPPSDSLKHQSHKLAEVLANLQRQSSLPAPPPPYALNTTTTNNLSTPILDEEDVDDDLNLAPIVIKIDTSITIDGQDNTVAIPSSTAAGSSASEAQSPTSDTTPTPTSTRAILQQLQQQRQTKSAQLANTIIGALKASGALDDLETGRQRPIELEVNAGIHVKGNSNTVCAEARRKTTPSSTSATSGDSRLSRKRRAQSEPLEMPSLKKTCTSTEAE